MELLWVLGELDVPDFLFDCEVDLLLSMSDAAVTGETPFFIQPGNESLVIMEGPTPSNSCCCFLCFKATDVFPKCACALSPSENRLLDLGFGGELRFKDFE